MLRLVLVLCFFGATFAAPAEVPSIILYESDSDGNGKYNFAFKTSDGIERQEQSEVVNAGDPEKQSVIVRGSYSYIGPDGVTYTVTYIADENGFHPQGAHLPVAPLPIGVDPSLGAPDLPAAPFPPGVIASLLG